MLLVISCMLKYTTNLNNQGGYMNYTDIIVKNIKTAMELKGINANQLSKKANISRSTLSKILNNVRDEIKISTLINIAKALNISLDDLCNKDTTCDM